MAGIVVGVLVGLLAVAVFVILLLRRKSFRQVRRPLVWLYANHTAPTSPSSPVSTSGLHNLYDTLKCHLHHQKAFVMEAWHWCGADM